MKSATAAFAFATATAAAASAEAAEWMEIRSLFPLIWQFLLRAEILEEPAYSICMMMQDRAIWNVYPNLDYIYDSILFLEYLFIIFRYDVCCYSLARSLSPALNF